MTSFGYDILGFGVSGGAVEAATGGTITTSGEYTVHTFLSSGTFTTSSNMGLAVGNGAEF